jgi:glycosyltransferase involved in cell wall biosynthesis
MKSNPLVTVYIPCKDYARFLSQSIESVLSQTYESWELIIFDEASSDNTFEIAQNFQSRYPEKIQFIKNDKPMGLQKLANYVLGIAKGKYMMRLDADDWLDDIALYLMVHKLESSKNAGIIYGNYYYTNEDGRVLGVELRHDLGDQDSVGYLPPHGACTMFNSRALKSVGGYSEDVNAQDGWDLWYKLSNRINAINIHTPLFFYRQHNNSLSRDNQRLLKARSKIFENLSNKLEGDYQPSVLVVIPVKESYPDFPGVPYQEINGCSLLEIAISNAFKSSKVNSVVVSSESKMVLDFSLKLENEGKVPPHLRLLRDDKTKSDQIPIKDFMVSGGNMYHEQNGVYPDVVTYLSLHAVNRKSEHIDKALNVLRMTEADSVVSVTEEREPIFSYGANGLELFNPGRFQDLSFDREKLYRFNGSIISTWWEILLSSTLFGKKISHIEMTLMDSIQLRNLAMLKNYQDQISN